MQVNYKVLPTTVMPGTGDTLPVNQIVSVSCLIHWSPTTNTAYILLHELIQSSWLQETRAQTDQVPQLQGIFLLVMFLCQTCHAKLAV